MVDRMLDPRSLDVVRAVGTRGGVTAAAALLHVTPSAVSQTLAALSHQVGMPVTHKVGRTVRLTPAGEVLAAASIDVGAALERARAACDALRTQPVGTVTVSAFASGARMLFPELLTWARTIPGLTVLLVDGDVATDQFAALTDEVDVVIGHHPESAEPWTAAGSRVITLLREPLDVALPLDHRLADRLWLTAQDLIDEEWISVRREFPIAEVLAAVTGGEPHVAQRVNDFPVIEALVAAGHGISLLPRYTTAAQGRFRLLPLRGVRAARSISALVRFDHAERLAVRRVLDRLVDQAQHLTAETQQPGTAQ